VGLATTRRRWIAVFWWMMRAVTKSLRRTYSKCLKLRRRSRMWSSHHLDISRQLCASYQPPSRTVRPCTLEALVQLALPLFDQLLRQQRSVSKVPFGTQVVQYQSYRFILSFHPCDLILQQGEEGAANCISQDMCNPQSPTKPENRPPIHKEGSNYNRRVP
jgi:hypothetical protein